MKTFRFLRLRLKTGSRKGFYLKTMNPDRRSQRSITTGSQQSGVQGPQRELQQGVRIGVTCIGCPNWSLSLKGLKNPYSTVGTDNTGGVLY